MPYSLPCTFSECHFIIGWEKAEGVSKYICTFLESLRTLMNHNFYYINIIIKIGNFWRELTVASGYNIDLFFILETVCKIQQMQLCFTLNYSLLQCMPSTNSRSFDRGHRDIQTLPNKKKLKCHWNHLFLIPLFLKRKWACEIL